MSRPSPTPDFTLRGSDSAVTCINYFGDHLLSGTQSGSLSSWSLRTRRPSWVIDAHKNSVLSICVLSDNRLLTHGRDGAVRVWSLGDIEQRPQLSDSFEIAHLGFCGARTFTIDCQEHTAVPSENSTVHIRNISTSDVTSTVAPSGSKPRGMIMAIQPLELRGIVYILSGYEDGSLSLWDTSNQKEISSCSFFNESIMCFNFSSQIQRGVVASAANKIIIFQIDDDLNMKLVRTVELVNPGIHCVKFRSDGKLFVTGGWDSRVRIFSGKNFKALAVLNAHSDGVQCVDFNQDNCFATGSKDKTIAVWSVYK